jgi:predicted secreted protein
MMILHGVDVYIRTPETPELPKEIGKFRLILISNRGTKVYPPPAPEMHLLDWPRCRFLSDEQVSDQEVDELVAHLSGLGWQWTKCQKLFKIDGVDAFSQPY